MDKMVLNNNLSLILDKLLEEFDKGQLIPGQWINAARIASDLGLSRGPVREALAILYGQGIIDFKQNHGAVLVGVSPYTILNRFRIAASIISFALHEIDYESLTQDELDKLKQLNDDASNYTLDQPLYMFFWANLEALKFMVSLVGHQEHNIMLERINPAYSTRFMAHVFDPDKNLEISKKNHKRIVEAMFTRDKPLVVSAYQYQVKWLSGIIEKTYEHKQEEFYEPINISSYLRQDIA